MSNLLVLFLGAIMMVVAMVCANSVEMFRATVCVLDSHQCAPAFLRLYRCKDWN